MLSETTPYGGSTSWTGTELVPDTTYWLVFSFEYINNPGTNAKVKFSTSSI